MVFPDGIWRINMTKVRSAFLFLNSNLVFCLLHLIAAKSISCTNLFVPSGNRRTPKNIFFTTRARKQDFILSFCAGMIVYPVKAGS